MGYSAFNRRIKKYRSVLSICIIFLGFWLLKKILSTDVEDPPSLRRSMANIEGIASDKEFIDLDLGYHDQHLAEGSHFDFNVRKGLYRQGNKCIEYEQYSKVRHPPFSKGKYQYSYMRPSLKCRTFVSDAVERVIEDLKLKVKDDDLARLIENCLPNTLDTTIAWHKSTLRGDKIADPETFIVTGDIHAEWLRDSARQLSVYQPFIKYDKNLKEMIKGAINTQAFYISNSPYCNAFHAPPGSNVKKGDTAKDAVFPAPDWNQVFECKYELDSLASFLTLSNEFYINSEEDLSFINDSWCKAFEMILVIIQRELHASFDSETGFAKNFFYSFQRNTNIGSETLPLGGVGNPVNSNTGLVRSAFRPSDDACILQYFIPANCHLLAGLKKARILYLNAKNLNTENAEKLIKFTDSFIDGIEKGIEKHGIVDHPKWGKVYAYEVDGYGSAIFMDDANIPSLLSLPDMGFLDINDEIYQNTRKMILSKEGNPYYLKGRSYEGIGGPHVGILNFWPMSSLMRIRTTNDDDEILHNLEIVMKSTAGLGLMHESVNVHSPQGGTYTRPWFAWCNSEFGKTILDLAVRKPHLIFKDEFAHEPYHISKVLDLKNPN